MLTESDLRQLLRSYLTDLIFVFFAKLGAYTAQLSIPWTNKCKLKTTKLR